MHQADRSAHGIDEKDCATISHVNSKTNSALVCHQAIAALKTFAVLGCGIDQTNAITMHLLRGHERSLAEPGIHTNFPMDAIQPSERFHPIARHLEAGDTQRETVNDRQRPERRKFLSRKLNVAHLPEVVVRVVRVVVLV
jgi:hypothetical protein